MDTDGDDRQVERRRMTLDPLVPVHRSGFVLAFAVITAATGLAWFDHHIWIAAMNSFGLACIFASREDLR